MDGVRAVNDKRRIFIYVQSSGANMPWILKNALSKGLNYVHDIMEFLGIETFEELLVNGTGTSEADRLSAIRKATKEIDPLVGKLFLP